jgi:hypothetical protein
MPKTGEYRKSYMTIKGALPETEVFSLERAHQVRSYSGRDVRSYEKVVEEENQEINIYN